MQVTLNGESASIPDHYTVRKLVEEFAPQAKRYAVEINLEIVPKSEHQERLICAGDRIEIVQAIGGG
ncbi:MAG: sulfur carrier protein ThiS [bacterium]